jgi:hypothetical protein
MQRFPDWAARLEFFLLEQAERRFEYGRWDCCLFVCDAIAVMTGVDPAAEFRGRYDSARTAGQLIRRSYGAHSVAAIAAGVAARFGMREVPMRLAGRGDVVLIRRKRDSSLGLVALDGAHVIVLAGSVGMARVPRFAGHRAWAV